MAALGTVPVKILQDCVHILSLVYLHNIFMVHLYMHGFYYN